MTPERILYLANLARTESLIRGALIVTGLLVGLWFALKQIRRPWARTLTGWPFWTLTLCVNLGWFVYGLTL